MEPILLLGLNPQGWDLPTTWVQTGYCQAHGRMTLPPSLKSIGNISIQQLTIKHSSAESKNQENSVKLKILNLKREYTFQIG